MSQQDLLAKLMRRFSNSYKLNSVVKLQGLIDSKPPKGIYLVGKYKKSFAYHSFANRMPKIIDSTIQNVFKDRRQLVEQYGQGACEDVDRAIKDLCQLRSEINNNGYLKPLTDKEQDSESWNKFLEKIPQYERTFYFATWIYAECYLFRRMVSCFKNTCSLKNYDFFRRDKERALVRNGETICGIVAATRDTPKSEEMLTKLLKLNLWGNQADLALDITKEVNPMKNLLSNIGDLDGNILNNDSCLIWNHLTKQDSSTQIVDFICDNSAFELFTDLILAEYLIDKGLACKIRFNVKALPWFVSDVTLRDFFFTIFFFRNNETNKTLREFGEKLCQYIIDGKFETAPEDFFWTGPYEFCRMESVNPNLYKRLAEAHLVIFKGDLNYRKLLRDFNWDWEEPFAKTLGGFAPTNVCSLRTVKADIISGVSKKKMEDIFSKKPNWMITGEYGVIHFASKDSLAVQN